MSSYGFQDGQEITGWLGVPLVETTGLALGGGSHVDGPFSVTNFASVIVALKPTGGPVVVKVTQGVTNGPASLQLVESVTVPDGAVLFEAFVLLGDAVTLELDGSVGGTTVDYAVYPSNTTTNTQAITRANIDIQHNDVRIASEPAIDLEDAASVLNWTVADDIPNSRAKVTPAWAADLRHPGDLYANFGASGQIRLSSQSGVPYVYFGSALDSYLYRAAASTLRTDAVLQVGGLQSLSGSQAIGYAAGGGGTVTQLTSKSTAVTLNSPSGIITMNNAALAGGAFVGFQFNNSYLAGHGNAVLLVCPVGGYATLGSYTAEAATNNGTGVIYLTNKTGGSLSEAVQVAYVIVTASTT